METRSRSKLRDSNSPPRATTVGGTQPVIVTSVSHLVEPPSSATGHARGGKNSSRSSSLEAGRRRAYCHVPRSESTGGARGSAQEIALDQEKTGITDSGEVCQHTPDEGATFTLVPSEESANRSSATATPYSASRELADASPRGLPTSGADFNIRAAIQVGFKQSAPGPSNVAWAGITQTKDRQSDVRVGYEKSTFFQPAEVDRPQVRPALTSVTSQPTKQTLLTATAETVASPSPTPSNRSVFFIATGADSSRHTGQVGFFCYCFCDRSRF